MRIGPLGTAHPHVADHLRAIERHPRARLAGTWPGAEGSISAAELVERSDVVVVDAPTAEHAELVEVALHARRALFVEKPPECTRAETERIAARIAETGALARGEPDRRRLSGWGAGTTGRASDGRPR